MKKRRNLFTTGWYRNKYVLTFLGMLVWISFFDRNDFFTTWKYRKKLNGLKMEMQYYDDEIRKYSEDLKYLTDRKANMEKYGREKYLMKKDDEHVFVVVREKVADKEAE